MTEIELSKRIRSITSCGYGHWRVVIKFRGKEYSCITTNSLAYDMRNWEKGEPTNCGYRTRKQALKALYDECVRKNELR